MAFTLSSSAFETGRLIPAFYTCDGENLSPALCWHDAPLAMRSFVLILTDPDAPHGTFTHWLLYDIPGSLRELPLAVRGVGRVGQNDFVRLRYDGPCLPSVHAAHRYLFTLYALGIAHLELEPGATQSEVLAAMEPHILDQAQLMGRYERLKLVETREPR